MTDDQAKTIEALRARYPWNSKGNLLCEQKRHEDALAAHEKAIALDADFAWPWNGKGNVLYDQKRYDEALAAYEKAISLDSIDD